MTLQGLTPEQRTGAAGIIGNLYSQILSLANKEFEGVFIFDNGKARFVEVTTGIKGDQEIELKSGPKETERIIIGPYKTLRNLKDGDLVKEEAKPAGPETKS